jgi:transposase
MLVHLVAAEPDLTLAELQDRLQRRCGIRVGLSTLHVTLHRLGLRDKKRMARPICKGDERRRAGLHQRIRSQAQLEHRSSKMDALSIGCGRKSTP